MAEGPIVMLCFIVVCMARSIFSPDNRVTPVRG